MITIPVVKERCAGIDVGKRGLAIAVMTGPADKEAAIQTRWLGTTVPELEALRQWLIQEGVTSVAMESTGSYWIPIKNVLENGLQIVLVCSQKHHPKKGEKTDFRDAIQLAHLHRHGMLTASYMPERGVVELRDLNAAAKEAAGESGGREEPYPEDSGSSQCEDRQYHERRVRYIRAGDAGSAIVRTRGRSRRDRGDGEEAVENQDPGTYRNA